MRLARAVARVGPVRALAQHLDERLPHGRRTVEYFGATLVYRRGDPLVERNERWGGYEHETIAAISRELEATESRILLDVGANIGLISLGVLATVPGASVYAFEPGPRQRALLARTIRRNGLESRIELSALALSDSAGRADFAVHSSRHVAGDGFRDTGRAGRGRVVTVETETLDRWWDGKARPRVAVVKLDTEGSELMILRGGGAMLAQCRPVLFLEIHPVNLRVYPYGPEDVRREVERMGYRFEELSPTEFLARPR